MTGAPIPGTDLYADERPVAEAQPLEVVLDGPDVVVVDFGGEHREELPETLRRERICMLVGDLAQALQRVDETPERSPRLTEHRFGRFDQPAVEDLALRLDRCGDHAVHLPHDGGVVDRIPDDLPAIGDTVQVGEAREHRVACDLLDVGIAVSHCPEQRRQFEIGDERRCIVGEGGRQIDVPVRMKQVGAQHSRRPFNCS